MSLNQISLPISFNGVSYYFRKNNQKIIFGKLLIQNGKGQRNFTVELSISILLFHARLAEILPITSNPLRAKKSAA